MANTDVMLEQSVIQPSTSPLAAGIVLVKRKDKSMRFCVDYGKPNAATIKNFYILPRINESLDHLSKLPSVYAMRQQRSKNVLRQYSVNCNRNIFGIFRRYNCH